MLTTAPKPKFPGLTLKAWALFNGSTATIKKSFNVAGVNRSAAGTYTANFTAALSTTDYLVTAICSGTLASNARAVGNSNGFNTACGIVVMNEVTGAAVDENAIYFECWE